MVISLLHLCGYGIVAMCEKCSLAISQSDFLGSTAAKMICQTGVLKAGYTSQCLKGSCLVCPSRILPDSGRTVPDKQTCRENNLVESLALRKTVLY